MSVLVLNASYEPIGVVSWRRAVVLMVSDVVDLTEADADGRVIRSAGGLEIQRPAVVRCRRMVPALRNRPVPWTRANLRIRDQGICQVAGCNKPGNSIDHLQPVSRGGAASSWTNTALMCARMNQAKSDRTLDEVGWTLKTQPRAPMMRELLANKVIDHPEWGQWVA